MEQRAKIQWPVGPHDEWTVEMTWYDDDRNGPGELLIRSTDPDNRPAGGLSQTLLREIDFSKAVEVVRATDSVSENIPKIDWETIGGELAEISAQGITDRYLAMLSLVYSATAATTPKPLEYIAEISGKSASAIKSHLWQATRKGLLERSPGRAGGRFTMKGVGLLQPAAGND